MQSKDDSKRNLTQRNITPKDNQTLTQRAAQNTTGTTTTQSKSPQMKVKRPKTELEIEELVRQQTREFKIEIEKRFSQSKHNHNFNFPLDYYETSDDESLESIQDIGVYDLHQQNFHVGLRKKSLSEKLFRPLEVAVNKCPSQERKIELSKISIETRQTPSKSTYSHRLEDKVKQQLQLNNELKKPDMMSQLNTCKNKVNESLEYLKQRMLNKSTGKPTSSTNNILIKLLQKNGMSKPQQVPDSSQFSQIRSPTTTSTATVGQTYFSKKDNNTPSQLRLNKPLQTNQSNNSFHNFPLNKSIENTLRSNNSFYQNNANHSFKLQQPESRSTSIYQTQQQQSQLQKSRSQQKNVTSNNSRMLNLNNSFNKQYYLDLPQKRKLNTEHSTSNMHSILRETTNVVSPTIIKNAGMTRILSQTNSKMPTGYIQIDNFLASNNNNGQHIKIGSITGRVYN